MKEANFYKKLKNILLVFCILFITIYIVNFLVQNRLNFKKYTPPELTTFNSVEAGIRPNFSIDIPSNWFNTGGDVSGGSASSFYFFEKEKFPKTWGAVQRGETRWPSFWGEEGESVAKVGVYGTSMSEMIFEYNNKSAEDVIINGHPGEKISGIDQETGEKKITLFMPEVKFNDYNDSVIFRFYFTMTADNKYSEEIFNQIIYTIEFN